FSSQSKRRLRKEGEGPRESGRRRHRAGDEHWASVVNRGKNKAEANAAKAKERRGRKEEALDEKNFRSRIWQRRQRFAAPTKKAAAQGERRRLRLRKNKRTVWRRLSRALI